MNWNQIAFERAFGTAEQLTASDLPEICFSGRSNVGKSSLLNRLVGRKSLARVSGKPGKTVTVNFFRMGDVRLVDLPGYGYAKVPFSERDRWSELMEHYFGSGREIRLTVQLIDMRHPASADDCAMLDFLRQTGYPYCIVLTKSDKLNRAEYAERLAAFPQELGELAAGVPMIPFSSQNGDGAEELRALIEQSCPCGTEE